MGTVCFSIASASGRTHHSHRPPAGKPRRRPGPLDHRRHAPAAPAPGSGDGPRDRRRAPAGRERRPRVGERGPPPAVRSPGATGSGPRGPGPVGSPAGRVGGGRVRPVADQSLHVTLCFLGSRAESDVAGIAAACAVIAAEPAARLALAEGLWLPPRRPRVLAVRLEDAERRLARLQGELSAALAAGGLVRAGESGPSCPTSPWPGSARGWARARLSYPSRPQSSFRLPGRALPLAPVAQRCAVRGADRGDLGAGADRPASRLELVRLDALELLLALADRVRLRLRAARDRDCRSA